MGKKEEIELKLRGQINNQLKYSDTHSRDASLKKLVKALDILSISHGEPVQINNEDKYFDTADLFFHKRQVSVRIRKQNGKTFFTWKDNLEKASRSALKIRDEVEVAISPDQERKTITEFLKNVYHRDFDLQSPVMVINCRYQIPIQSELGSYTLSFDKYSFYSHSINAQSDDFYEIEIESEDKNRPDNDPQIIQYVKILNDLFDYTTESLTKYEKGLRWTNDPIVARNKAFVLFDIVKYSRQKPLEQRIMICEFSAVVQNVLACNGLLDECLNIPTGDGMIIAFNDTQKLLPLLISIYHKIKEKNGQVPLNNQICFRTAVHYGLIFEYQDINSNINYAGDGINYAARILSKSNDWQILVSDDFYEQYKSLGGSEEGFSDKYSIEVKHGVNLDVRNYHNRPRNIGTPERLNR